MCIYSLYSYTTYPLNHNTRTRTHTHTYTYTHTHMYTYPLYLNSVITVKVKNSRCGYVVIRGVNDSEYNVLKTSEYLLQRKWVSNSFLYMYYDNYRDFPITEQRLRLYFCPLPFIVVVYGMYKIINNVASFDIFDQNLL